MNHDETKRPSNLKLNRETLRRLTHAQPLRPQNGKGATAPMTSCASPCCTQRCISDEE